MVGCVGNDLTDGLFVDGSVDDLVGGYGLLIYDPNLCMVGWMYGHRLSNRFLRW